MNELRAEIAGAASLVAGVHVKPYYRQTTKPGDGWVSLQRSDRDESGFGFMDRWAVTLVLPQDVKAAEDWMDSHIEQLAEALKDYLIVTAFVPAALRMDSGEVNGLVVEGTRGR